MRAKTRDSFLSFPTKLVTKKTIRLAERNDDRIYVDPVHGGTHSSRYFYETAASIFVETMSRAEVVRLADLGRGGWYYHEDDTPMMRQVRLNFRAIIGDFQRPVVFVIACALHVDLVYPTDETAPPSYRRLPYSSTHSFKAWRP